MASNPNARSSKFLLLPETWLGLIINNRGAGTADATTCLVLAKIYGWYTPSTDETTLETRVKFAGDMLQLQTTRIASELNLSSKCVNDALNTLAERGLISRIFKDVKVDGSVFQERQYIYLHVDAMAAQGFITEAQADTMTEALGTSYIQMVSTFVDNSQNVDTNGNDVYQTSIPLTQNVDTNGNEMSIPMDELTYNHDTFKPTTENNTRDFSLKNLNLASATALLLGWDIERTRAEQLAMDYMAQAEHPNEADLKIFAGITPAPATKSPIRCRIDERITKILAYFGHPLSQDDSVQRQFRRTCDAVKSLATSKGVEVLAFVYAQFEAYVVYKEKKHSAIHGQASNFVSALLQNDYASKLAQEFPAPKEATTVRDLASLKKEDDSLIGKMNDLAFHVSQKLSVFRRFDKLNNVIAQVATAKQDITNEFEYQAWLRLRESVMRAVIERGNEVLQAYDTAQVEAAGITLRIAWQNLERTTDETALLTEIGSALKSLHAKAA